MWDRELSTNWRLLSLSSLTRFVSSDSTYNLQSLSQYVYIVKMDNKIYGTYINTSPQELTNVDVYGSNNALPALDGVMRNLEISSVDTTGFSYVGKLNSVITTFLPAQPQTSLCMRPPSPLSPRTELMISSGLSRPLTILSQVGGNNCQSHHLSLS